MHQISVYADEAAVLKKHAEVFGLNLIVLHPTELGIVQPYAPMSARYLIV